MIPRFKADIGLSDMVALLPRGGDAVTAFEKAFAQLAGQREAVAFPYGRTAQMMILKALGLKEKNKTEIICPSYTCVVVAHAIAVSGLTPVFVDVAVGGYNMDWELAEKATTAKTGALIATSVFGEPVDLAALEAYHKRHPDVVILQDGAHSFFAADVHKEGFAAFYGLNISKIITSIFGGMVTTDDTAFAAKLREERARNLTPPGLQKSLMRSLYLMAAYIAFLPPVYGLVNWLERQGFLDRFARYYDPAKIDMPADALTAMSAVEARVGLLQCRRYGAIVAHRRKLARIYLDGLRDAKNIQLPEDKPGATWSHFTVRTPKARAIIETARRHGVQLGELIEYDIADMPVYKSAAYFGELRARAYVGNVINLPVHVGVSEADARRIITMVKSV